LIENIDYRSGYYIPMCQQSQRQWKVYTEAITPPSSEETMSLKVIHCNPQIYSGAPVFVGTRVPLAALFDYLKAGESLDSFLDAFPSVTKSLAIGALEIAERLAADHAHSAR
jgi:uncharacterized protein (DUF433 family)